MSRLRINALVGLLLLVYGQQEAHAAGPAPAAASAPTQSEAARGLSRLFGQVVDEILPSVVFIRAQKVRTNRRIVSKQGEVLSPDALFFGALLNSPELIEERSRQLEEDDGSGVILDGNGHILVSHHVVSGARKIKVRFFDGTELSARLLGADPYSDSAVLAVDAKGTSMKPARLGDSARLSLGEWLLAIGSPFALHHTVTAGVLSAKGRSGVGPASIQALELLQTDAAINPGSSGGPLVNLNGEVVGINTAILSSGSTGIGFAVPIESLKPIIAELLRTGKFRRGYIGIVLQELTPAVAEALASPAKGVLLLALTPGAPAENAGLMRGDVIVEVDGKPVSDSAELQRRVLSHGPGDALELKLWRKGRLLTVSVRAAAPPPEEDEEPAGANEAARRGQHHLGLSLKTVDPLSAQRFELPVAHGVLIQSVQFDSLAAEAGLARGDIILEVDARRVRDAGAVFKSLNEARPGGHLLLVQREESSFFTAIRLPNPATYEPQKR